MRIVLTGATGFIGGYLIRALSPTHELYCLARDTSRLPQVTNVIPVPGDLAASDGLAALPASVDAVVHFAQANVPFPEHAEELFQVNATSTVGLADYARRAGASAFIYASSGNVYGQQAAPLDEDSPLRPQGLYGLTKRVSEQVIGCYEEFFNFSVLRLFAPYGPGQTGRMMPGIANRVRSGQEVTLTNGGQPRINPIYFEDVARIVESALSLSGQHVVNVAGPEVVSVEDIARMAGEALGVEAQLRHQTDAATWNLIASTDRMQALFDPRDMVTPSDGIQRMIRAEAER